jgi:hypothetical protein
MLEGNHDDILEGRYEFMPFGEVKKNQFVKHFNNPVDVFDGTIQTGIPR